jgi:type VI secretion system secreted protein Hcp
MPFTCFVTIEGETQGKFKGESTLSKLGEGKISVLRFSSQVAMPFDAASGLPTGKRQHKAIEFLKEVGPASPQLFQALVTNEVLKSVGFEFVTTTATGEDVVSYTVTLTNASVRVSEVSLDRTARGKPFDAHDLHRVVLTFQKIVHEHKLAKVSAQDDWVQQQ